jgi:hypothetical protein
MRRATHPHPQGTAPLAPSFQERRGAAARAPGLGTSLQRLVAHRATRLPNPHAGTKEFRAGHSGCVNAINPVSHQPAAQQTTRVSWNKVGPNASGNGLRRRVGGTDGRTLPATLDPSKVKGLKASGSPALGPESPAMLEWMDRCPCRSSSPCLRPRGRWEGLWSEYGSPRSGSRFRARRQRR